MTELIHFTDGDIECSCKPLRLTIMADGSISRIAGGPLEEPIDTAAPSLHEEQRWTEPCTEAGQQLLADFRDEDGEWLAPWRVRGMILAIEAEARGPVARLLSAADALLDDRANGRQSDIAYAELRDAIAAARPPLHTPRKLFR